MKALLVLAVVTAFITFFVFLGAHFGPKHGGHGPCIGYVSDCQ